MTWTPRENIYGTLFTTLINLINAALAAQQLKPLQTTSRKLRGWAEMDGAAMPALFQRQLTEDPIKVTTRGVDHRWRLNVDEILYVFSPDDSVAPTTIMNPILDVIEAAVTSPTGSPITLNNSFVDVRIRSRIETDEGTLGEKALAVIPLEILA